MVGGTESASCPTAVTFLTTVRARHADAIAPTYISDVCLHLFKKIIMEPECTVSPTPFLVSILLSLMRIADNFTL